MQVMRVSSAVEAELSALLRAAIAGDDRAYARFLGRTATIVRNFVRRRLSDGGGVDAEDVVQDTLLAIHTKRHTWESDEAVLPWVLAISRYKLIDAFRRRGRRIEVDLDEVIESVAQPEQDTVDARDVDRALAGLAPGQRSVVAAISVEGRSISETAARLGMSETAVRVALHRGLRSIAQRFGQTA
jgi:RNA polymerase sigma-70 factor (ECF subfamily)